MSNPIYEDCLQAERDHLQSVVKDLLTALVQIEDLPAYLWGNDSPDAYTYVDNVRMIAHDAISKVWDRAHPQSPAVPELSGESNVKSGDKITEKTILEPNLQNVRAADAGGLIMEE